MDEIGEKLLGIDAEIHARRDAELTALRKVRDAAVAYFQEANIKHDVKHADVFTSCVQCRGCEIEGALGAALDEASRVGT